MCMFQDILKFGSIKPVANVYTGESSHEEEFPAITLAGSSRGVLADGVSLLRKNLLDNTFRKRVWFSTTSDLKISQLFCIMKEASIHFPHDLTRLKSRNTFISCLRHSFARLISHWSVVHCRVSTRNVSHSCTCTILAQCGKDFLPMTTHYGERAQGQALVNVRILDKGKSRRHFAHFGNYNAVNSPLQMKYPTISWTVVLGLTVD